MGLLWKVGHGATQLGRRGADLARRARDARRLARFDRGGRVPWSDGYFQARSAFLADALSDTRLIQSFITHGPLPSGYGIGIDERAIEIPWVLTRWRAAVGRALDAGSALNHPEILNAIADPSSLTILTLHPEGFADWQRGVSYAYADVRETPFRDGWFSRIASVSTLEHVGMDNRGFGDARAKTDQPLAEMSDALRELWRVLAPGGELCVTVPFGSFADHGAFLSFDERSLAQVFSVLPAEAVVERFRYGATGWHRAEPGSCAGSAYVEWLAEAFRSGRFPTPVPLEPDRAAAARAVACVSVVKPRG